LDVEFACRLPRALDRVHYREFACLDHPSRALDDGRAGFDPVPYNFVYRPISGARPMITNSGTDGVIHGFPSDPMLLWIAPAD
jgi:hypothetical protein